MVNKMEEQIKKISEQLDKYEWFYMADQEQDHIVVYVNYMNEEVLKAIPDDVDGVRIKAAFTAYLNALDRLYLDCEEINFAVVKKEALN